MRLPIGSIATLRVAVVLAAVVLAGCAIVSRDHLEQLQAGDAGPRDGAMPPGDVGTDAFNPDLIVLVDECGDPDGDYVVLDDSTDGTLDIDTRSLSNDIGTCGSRAAPGNDGFLAIDVMAGHQWHFHVVPDPTVAGQDRDPFLYLLPATGGSCDARDCNSSSDNCQGGGDEHFAFVAPSTGIFYLGIDDRNPGGGQYRIQAVRLVCGDGAEVHGEACDGTTGCDSRCRVMVSESSPNEVEPADNEIEANAVVLPASGELTITGAIGGDLCIYPDVFSLVVPQEGMTLDVRILKPDGTACDNSSLTPFDIILRSSSGAVRAGPMTVGGGCAGLTVSGLAMGTYLLYLEHAEPIEDRVVPYQLHIALSL